MNKTLRLHIVPSTVLRAISPKLLVKLAKKFREMDAAAMQCVNIGEYEDFEKIGGGPLPLGVRVRYESFIKEFAEAIMSLKSPDNDVLISEVHLLTLCVSDKVGEKLEQITHDKQHGQSTSDYIVAVYLRRGIDVLHQAYRLNSSRKIRHFDYYVPNFQPYMFEDPQHPAPPHEPSHERLSDTENTLSEVFDENYASSFCILDCALVGKRVYLDIRHAGNTMHGDKVDDKSSKVKGYTVKPVEYDMVLLDLETMNLCIHMENPRAAIMQEYVKVAGVLFFDRKDYWQEPGQKYDLSPMTKKTRRMLREMLDVEKAKQYVRPKDEGRTLERVRLISAEFTRTAADGTEQSYRRASEGCLTKDMDTDDELLVAKERLKVKSIGFGFDLFRCGSNMEACKIVVTKYGKDEIEYLEGVDDWLAVLGFCQSPRTYDLPNWYSRLTEQQKAQFTPQVMPDDDDLFETPASRQGEFNFENSAPDNR